MPITGCCAELLVEDALLDELVDVLAGLALDEEELPHAATSTAEVSVTITAATRVRVARLFGGLAARLKDRMCAAEVLIMFRADIYSLPPQD